MAIGNLLHEFFYCMRTCVAFWNKFLSEQASLRLCPSPSEGASFTMSSEFKACSLYLMLQRLNCLNNWGHQFWDHK
ncbi:hypothetical protein PRUPE_7G032200 [Prunus persica]|uniref:Uncharacterized protein n=1 Tax=Prunus persica TaxID=3760 RepID=M5WEB6_PRUPE|nr:hypothetical protein PRUPE_7G032200 [Prunus persica]